MSAGKELQDFLDRIQALKEKHSEWFRDGKAESADHDDGEKAGAMK